MAPTQSAAVHFRNASPFLFAYSAAGSYRKSRLAFTHFGNKGRMTTRHSARAGTGREPSAESALFAQKINHSSWLPYRVQVRSGGLWGSGGACEDLMARSTCCGTRCSVAWLDLDTPSQVKLIYLAQFIHLQAQTQCAKIHCMKHKHQDKNKLQV